MYELGDGIGWRNMLGLICSYLGPEDSQLEQLRTQLEYILHSKLECMDASYRMIAVD